MTRTVTAIFETFDVAQTVRREIEELGVSSRAIQTVPDTDASGGQRDDDVVSRLHYMNVPREDLRTYQEAVRQGHYVVSADVDDSHVEQVVEIMRHPERNGVDIDAYEAEYRGRDDYDPSLVPLEGYDTRGGEGEGEEHVQLAEERIAVGKRAVDMGTTTVRTYVQEVPVEERVRLRDEHISVERRPVERTVTGADADALFQERTVEVHETDEEAVVSKEAVVTEEVVVRKDVEEREEVVHDTVRKTEVDVDESQGAAPKRKDSAA